MTNHVLIILLTAFVAITNSLPFDVILKTGINSNAKLNVEGKTGVESGWESGPTIEGKASGEVVARWLKNAYGVIGYIDSHGVPHGIKVSIGSSIGGKGVAQASAKAGTNIISTKVDKDAKLDGEASYDAGFNIHYLDKDEVVGVEGVNKQTVKIPEETSSQNNVSEKPDQVFRNPKQVYETTQEEGYIKSIWNKHIKSSDHSTENPAKDSIVSQQVNEDPKQVGYIKTLWNSFGK